MPSQYQYQPLTGPVWTEPVAEKLAWLPRAQQPARALEYRRLGDFQQPPFQALYNPARIEWAPEDSYRGRALGRALVDWAVCPIVVQAPAYDPRPLDWLPRGHAPQTAIERRIRGDFQSAPFQALYKPEGLQWEPIDRYIARTLPRALVDTSVYPPRVVVAAYDPVTLEWIPSGRAPRVLLERRILGDFVQPPFAALYRSELLDWQARDRYTWRAAPRALFDATVEPFLPIVPPYDPRTLEWMPQGKQPRIAVERRIRGDFQQPPFAALYRPERLEWTPRDRYRGQPLPYSLQGWTWAFSTPISSLSQPLSIIGHRGVTGAAIRISGEAGAVSRLSAVAGEAQNIRGTADDE